MAAEGGKTVLPNTPVAERKKKGGRGKKKEVAGAGDQVRIKRERKGGRGEGKDADRRRKLH